MIRQALRRFLEAGLEDPVTVAKIEAREELWRQTRQRLQAATETKSISRINRAIGTFAAHKMEDKGEFQHAMEKLLSLSKRGKSGCVPH